MASIKKVGNGYKITISNGYDINGKKLREYSTFTPDPKRTLKQQQKDLNDFIYEFEQKVKNGKYLQGEKITFKNFSEYWLKEYAIQQLEQGSYKDYKDHLQNHIFPHIGHLKLAKISIPHLQSLYNQMLKDGVRLDGKSGGYSINTIKKCHAVISSIMNAATNWQVIDSNPCEKVKLPKKKKQNANEDKIQFFTLEQADIFLNNLHLEYTSTYRQHQRIDDTGKPYNVKDYTETHSLSYQLQVFFTLALFSGCRRGELLALTWDDINSQDNSISVNKSISRINQQFVTKTTKNDSSRVIHIPPDTIRMLKRLKLEQNTYRLSLGDQWINGNYIFTQWNGMPMNPSTPTHAFKKFIKRYNETVIDATKLLPEITLHGLRHTSATLLISESLDYKAVSARLGHSQTSTTLNIYTHSLSKSDEKASGILEDLFKKSSSR